MPKNALIKTFVCSNVRQTHAENALIKTFVCSNVPTNSFRKMH